MISVTSRREYCPPPLVDQCVDRGDLEDDAAAHRIELVLAGRGVAPHDVGSPIAVEVRNARDLPGLVSDDGTDGMSRVVNLLRPLANTTGVAAL